MGKRCVSTAFVQKNDIYTYGQLLDENEKRENGERNRQPLTRLFDIMTNTMLNNAEYHYIDTGRLGKQKFQDVTEKMIYEDLLQHLYRLHHYEIKWQEYFNTPIAYDKEVWKQVHNPITPESTKSLVWEHIHLNFGTTHKYNHYRQQQLPCPLCNQHLTDMYHIILHCPVTLDLWKALEPLLQQITPEPVTEKEMAFGMNGQSDQIIVRNWMTYILRQLIQKQEYVAYNSKVPLQNEHHIRIKYNHKIVKEINKMKIRYKGQNNMRYFDRLFTKNPILVTKQAENTYVIKKIF